jgi:hypothetical protein
VSEMKRKKRETTWGVDRRDDKEAQTISDMKFQNKLTSLFQIPESEVV